MIVNLPLRLTGTGKSGCTQTKSVTIRYQNGTVINNVSVIDNNITIMAFTMDKSSGFDDNENRITNIVGFDGNELIKLCPRCNGEKPTSRFGYKGRVTTSKRDQSECNDCRNSY